MKFNKSVVLKGSATVVVIFAAITSSIYMVSTFADYEHYRLTSDKYDTHLNKMYNTDNMENIYFAGLKTITEDNNFIIQSGPKKYIAKNLIENGDFEQGSKGWQYGTNHPENVTHEMFDIKKTSEISVISDGVDITTSEINSKKLGNLSIKVASILDNPYEPPEGEEISTIGMRYGSLIPSTMNHKYYASCYIYQDFKSKGLVNMRFGHTGDKELNIMVATPYLAHFSVLTDEELKELKEVQNNQWFKCSGIYENVRSDDTVASNYSSTSLYLWCSRTSENSGGYRIPSKGDYFCIDNVILIDLTETFGKGNEPDLEWCEKNISFFNGYKQLIK